MTQAFSDSKGGYYQTDETGTPKWAVGLTPCQVQQIVPPTQTPKQKIAALLAASGLTQEWQVESAIAGILAYALAQGISEPTLYATNPGYKFAKDAYTQIAALKAQIP